MHDQPAPASPSAALPAPSALLVSQLDAEGTLSVQADGAQELSLGSLSLCTMWALLGLLQLPGAQLLVPLVWRTPLLVLVLLCEGRKGQGMAVGGAQLEGGQPVLLLLQLLGLQRLLLLVPGLQQPLNVQLQLSGPAGSAPQGAWAAHASLSPSKIINFDQPRSTAHKKINNIQNTARCSKRYLSAVITS